MTAKKIVLIRCDRCGTTSLSPTMILSDVVHMLRPHTAVTEARAYAHEKGWVHDKHGRDLCPGCRSTPAPERPARVWSSPRHWGRH